MQTVFRRVSMAKLLIAIVVSVLFQAALQADDWPQWRGPNRDGVWHETGVLQSFPADGPQVRWRVPVGWGWSSPAVAQGRVYLTDAQLMRPTAKERVHCFECLPRTLGDGEERRVGDGDRQPGARLEQTVEAGQEGAASDHRDALFDQVGREFCGRPVENVFD